MVDFKDIEVGDSIILSHYSGEQRIQTVLSRTDTTLVCEACEVEEDGTVFIQNFAYEKWPGWKFEYAIKKELIDDIKYIGKKEFINRIIEEAQ